MYARPNHGGDTGARWAELQRQEADVVAALQAELASALRTIANQKETLEAFEAGSFLLITAYRENLEIIPEGCLTLERLNLLGARRVAEAVGDATRASVEGYHVTGLGHINFLKSYL